MHHAHTRIKDYLKKQFKLEYSQIETLLPGLLHALAQHMENMQKALSSGDLEQLGKAGHTMKGALLNLGLKECAEIAYEIELKSRAAEDSTDFNHLVVSLQEQLAEYLTD